MDVITTRLADCIGPINKPLIAARKKNVDIEKVRYDFNQFDDPLFQFRIVVVEEFFEVHFLLALED